MKRIVQGSSLRSSGEHIGRPSEGGGSLRCGEMTGKRVSGREKKGGQMFNVSVFHGDAKFKLRIPLGPQGGNKCEGC